MCSNFSTHTLSCLPKNMQIIRDFVKEAQSFYSVATTLKILLPNYHKTKTILVLSIWVFENPFERLYAMIHSPSNELYEAL